MVEETPLELHVIHSLPVLPLPVSKDRLPQLLVRDRKTWPSSDPCLFNKKPEWLKRLGNLLRLLNHVWWKRDSTNHFDKLLFLPWSAMELLHRGDKHWTTDPCFVFTSVHQRPRREKEIGIARMGGAIAVITFAPARKTIGTRLALGTPILRIQTTRRPLISLFPRQPKIPLPCLLQLVSRCSHPAPQQNRPRLL